MSLYKAGEEISFATPSNATPANASAAEQNTAEQNTASAPPPKRRGRPPGSKNRKPGDAASAANAVKLELPPEVMAVLAQAPLILAQKGFEVVTREKDPITKRVTRRGVILEFDEKTLNMTVTAFNAWMASLDLSLSPGWAYAAGVSLALGSAIPAAIAEAKDRNSNKAKVVNSEAVSTAPGVTNGEVSAEPASASNANGGSVSTDSAP